MSSFHFEGRLPASKSILNRWLVMSSYQPGLQVVGESQCDDVLDMKRALPRVLAGSDDPIEVGSAGTTFRFLALRASRLQGRRVLRGTPALMKRPHSELHDVLAQLGVRSKQSGQDFEIDSNGWMKPERPIRVDRSRSSQFASALLLNAWLLPFDLEIEGTPDGVSQGYLDMTKSMVRQAGMKLLERPALNVIPKQSAIQAMTVAAEMDLSSAFAVASLAAVGGEARIQGFPRTSLQPDAAFPDVLEKMGVGVDREADTIRFQGTGSLKRIEFNLNECPDLFPVLAVLGSVAEGESRLFGAPHLAFKESNRIEAVAKLLTLLNREFRTHDDGMSVHGSRASFPVKVCDFDPENDHRLAMAAMVAKQAGANLRILNPEVVNKSFPEFWNLVRKGGGAL